MRSEHGEWLEVISDEEKAAIAQSLKQLETGNGIPHNEAIKKQIWFRR